MLLQNRSGGDSIVLSDLCEFVIKHSKNHQKVFLDIVDQEGSKRTGGLANKDEGEQGCPSRITLWLSRNNKFPYVNKFEGLSARLTTWQEEFVLVLAHELRHIDQFWGKVPKEYELDAEQHAVKVLALYKGKL